MQGKGHGLWTSRWGWGWLVTSQLGGLGKSLALSGPRRTHCSLLGELPVLDLCFGLSFSARSRSRKVECAWPFPVFPPPARRPAPLSSASAGGWHCAAGTQRAMWPQSSGSQQSPGEDHQKPRGLSDIPKGTPSCSVSRRGGRDIGGWGAGSPLGPVTVRGVCKEHGSKCHWWQGFRGKKQ